MSMANRGRAAALGVAALVSATSALAATRVCAQVVERNLPPAMGPAVGEPSQEAVISREDPTPIGPPLSGVVLLGPSAPLTEKPVLGVDASALPRLDTDKGRRLLKLFLGRSLSSKLIAEIKVAITGYYRDEGYPFVAVQTPEQEITGGVLQLRIIEFSLGQVKIEGGKRTRPGHVAGLIRAVPGKPINGNDLEQDLDWLNRNPFRHVDTAFAPGQRQGDSDLRLRVTESRPWRAYGGYANSGAPSSGRDRYFIGGRALLGQEALLSYQFTSDGDGLAKHPKYASQAARLFAPIAPRQAFEASFSRVESNSAVTDFEVRQKTTEVTLGYVGALSNLVNMGGDLAAGVEVKRQKRDVFFGSIPVLSQPIDIYQLYAGWSDAAGDRLGRYDVDIAAHVSPGDLGASNSASAFRAYSGGRVTRANYVYLQGAYDRSTRLGSPESGVSLITQVIVQISTQALPDSVRIGLGGSGLVRSYSLDDGAYDRGVVVRNELRMTALNHAFGPVAAGPFAFLDAGYGEDKATDAKSKLVSVGLGLDAHAANSFSLSATAGYALRAAPATGSGDWRADVRLTAMF